MYVKPADGLSVPDPERGGLLAAAGRKVEPTTYWHKRVQCGDVKEITAAEHEQLIAAQAEADKPAAEVAVVQTSARSGRADK